MAFIRNVDTSTWEIIDHEFDLVPLPGSFVSNERKTYTIEGEQVEGLTYLHAFYLTVGKKIRAHGGELGKCDHCGARMRYCNIYQDDKGQWFHTGRDCGDLIGAKQAGKTPREFYLARTLMQIAQDARKVNTKQGKRVVWSMLAPAWVWDIPADQRRALCSVSKNSYKGGQWEVCLWGEDVESLIVAYERLHDHKPA